MDNVALDRFFRPFTMEEKDSRSRANLEPEEMWRLAEEASCSRALLSMAPDEVQQRIATLEADRKEMVILMGRCDRPQVKARLSEFLLDMDNELARLRQDPTELDDEDRRELRLFHLRKLRLPGAVRGFTEYVPTVLTIDPCKAEEPPWQAITMFALDLGEATSEFVVVDVRIEDMFDLKLQHTIEGIRYRLLKTCLERDIEPARSFIKVKRNHVLVHLAKVKETAKGSNLPAAQAAGNFPPWKDLCAADRRSRNPLVKALSE